MRFPTIFSRYKVTVPTGGKLLGSDAVPANGTPPASSLDNLLVSKASDKNGWPVHRVAVLYHFIPTAGNAAGADLTFDMYFYEDATAAWYKITSAAVPLKDGVVAFCDVISINDPPPTQANMEKANAGGIQQVLIVHDNAGADGRYDFAIAADLTTFP
jgi:hypothetical protein